MLFRLFLSVFIYLSLMMSAHAAECRATFADGLTNSKNSGKIHFKDKAKLFNGSDTILTTTEIKNDNDRNAYTCAFTESTGVNCSLDNNIVPQFTRSYTGASSDNKLEVNWDDLRHKHYEATKRFRPKYPSTEVWPIGIILHKRK